MILLGLRGKEQKIGLFKISVVIPTYLRKASVERALLGLSQQTLPVKDFEVIVVIDGSEDGTSEMVEGFDAPYALRVFWQSNRGRAAACNTGIKAARGRVVLLLDDDMEPAPGLLEMHWRAHMGGERLGVLGAVPVRLHARSAPIARYIANKFNKHLEKMVKPGYLIQIRDFYSGNFSIRREILLMIGLFDEVFRIYGNEDLDLYSRLVTAGVQMVYRVGALAYQHYDKTFEEFAWNKFEEGKTSVLLVRKHPQFYPGMRVSTYQQVTQKWRLLRTALLFVSQLWPKTPMSLIRLGYWLERRGAFHLDLYYNLVSDYFFWLGVRIASQEPAEESHLIQAIQSKRDYHESRQHRYPNIPEAILGRTNLESAGRTRSTGE